jgi:hypothetical protein
MTDLPGFAACLACGDNYALSHYDTGPHICAPCRALALSDLQAYTQGAKAHAVHLYRFRTVKRRPAMTHTDTGKQCTCCHQLRAFTDYDADTRRADGFQAECKACRKLRRSLRSDPAAFERVRATLRQSRA